MEKVRRMLLEPMSKEKPKERGIRRESTWSGQILQIMIAKVIGFEIYGINVC